LAACTHIHTLGNLTKYVPGYAWQLVSKTYLTRRAGVPLKAAGVALAIEFGGLIAVAVCLGLALLPSEAALPLAPHISPALRLLLAGAVAGGLVAAPLVLRHVQRAGLMRGLIGDIRAVRPKELWLAFVVMLGAWSVLGMGLVELVRSVYPLPLDHWPATASALALAFVIGFVVILAPAGVGVREAALTLLLSPYLPAGLAALVAIGSRLTLALSEVFGYAIAWAAQRATQTSGGQSPKGIRPSRGSSDD
jgi:hypothetical protein